MLYIRLGSEELPKNKRDSSKNLDRSVVGGRPANVSVQLGNVLGIFCQVFVQIQRRDADTDGERAHVFTALKWFTKTGPSRSRRSFVADESANVEQFVQLFAKHQRGVQAYLWTLVLNRADCDDLMQETSVSLWRKWPEFDPHRDFFRWACGIAFIEVLRFRRKTASQRLWFSEELMETLAVEFVDDAERGDMRAAALQACLEKLGERETENYRGPLSVRPRRKNSPKS